MKMWDLQAFSERVSMGHMNVPKRSGELAHVFRTSRRPFPDIADPWEPPWADIDDFSVGRENRHKSNIFQDFEKNEKSRIFILAENGRKMSY